jgi:hypothetical protein
VPRALVIDASRGLGLVLIEELERRDWQVTATTRDGVPRPSAWR